MPCALCYELRFYLILPRFQSTQEPTLQLQTKGDEMNVCIAAALRDGDIAAETARCTQYRKMETCWQWPRLLRLEPMSNS
jgi:hypothetical protein